jgi:anti-sigma B factor antagonist
VLAEGAPRQYHARMAEPGAVLEIEPTGEGWRLAGEIDAHTAPSLAAALRDVGQGRTFVADLAAVSFMDSSGLRVLVEATRVARDAGGDIELRNPQPAITRLVEISGLAGHLRIG